VVTGGGSGIGRAVALTLARDGWQIFIAGRRRQPLEETASAAPEGMVVPIGADVARPDSVAALFAEVERQGGRLDLLFNNAGVSGTPTPVQGISVADWTTAVDTNVNGMFWCAQAAFCIMSAQRPRGGRIINNGSISAHSPRPYSTPYTTTKHAVTGLTKSLALEGRGQGITCGQIDIGNAATDMTAAIASGVLQADGSTRAEPTMDVQHAADVVLVMASLPPEANIAFVTVMASEMPYVGRG
jgi:NAD(P)-dependent dehydrogenase (short-subunit alcohol dehydrogenase family)